MSTIVSRMAGSSSTTRMLPPVENATLVPRARMRMIIALAGNGRESAN
jgi:hypothetical protein